MSSIIGKGSLVVLMYAVLLVLLLVLPAAVCHAHFYNVFPPSRNNDPGLKSYPCGGRDRLSGPVTVLAPGQLTWRAKETIDHLGAPFRFALSVTGDDEGFSDLVLFDHLPHCDKGTANRYLEFTIDIPDINCSSCTLQVLNPMTDKIAAGTCCPYPESTDDDGEKCYSVYHSCSDVVITGTQDPLAWAKAFVSPAKGYSGPYGQESSDEWEEVSSNTFRMSASFVPQEDQSPCSGLPRLADWAVVLIVLGSLVVVGLAAGAVFHVVKKQQREKLKHADADANAVTMASM